MFMVFSALQVVEKKDEVDWKRHSVFCVFGFAYLVRSASHTVHTIGP
jgi:hypothetical protein